MKKVFISHAHQDKSTADLLCTSLESTGIGCWIAPRDIPYGNDWAGEITKAIKASELFVLLLSEHANKSRQCPKEIAIADNTGIPIICIKINDVEMAPNYEYHLSMSQTMTLSLAAIDKHLADIVSVITQKLSTQSTNQHSGTSTKKHRPASSSSAPKADTFFMLPYLLGAFTCCLALFALLIYLVSYYMHNSQLDFSFLPESIFDYLYSRPPEKLKGLISLTVLCLSVFYIRYVRTSDIRLRRLICEGDNIDESFFSYTIGEFVRNVLLFPHAPSILKNNIDQTCEMENFSEYKSFRGMEIGSTDGNQVDYLFVHYNNRVFYHSSIFTLYLDSSTSKKNACRILSLHGYVLQDEQDDILHFRKQDLNLYLSYTMFGINLIALEMTRGTVSSCIREKVSNDPDIQSSRSIRSIIEVLSSKIAKIFITKK